MVSMQNFSQTIFH